MSSGMDRRQVLDLYFLEARGRLIEVAAFLDRVERASGEGDFRWPAFRKALEAMTDGAGAGGAGCAERVLLALSDPTVEPVAKAPGKGAVGAWPGEAGQ